MTDSFHAHIRAALANPNLHAALDANAERRRAVRLEAYSSLPEDIQALRQRAHALRAEVIANLDRYLDRFIAQARRNGMIVHRAADAAQAVEAVLEVARAHGARRIAKAKSMLSEEIGLNPALEAAGLQVVETDLGEYIVQLRGEHPAHIITPAVHLRRADVGQTFHEKLGIPFTEDIPTLTTTARRVLRQTFLEADLGISGVNFGVVENGALCLVTNEGNGRMVTTLPPVHLALMGIERLVPTLDDLALMLYLLPRSATGQKLSVYTSLIRSPGSADVEGPRERHLLLVDNGRSALRRSPLMEALYCIRCGACLNACPVFREIGGHAYVNREGQGSPYTGPIGAVISPALFGQAEFGQLARASSLCGACREACPVDIDLPKLLLRVRAGEVAEKAPASPGTRQPNPPASLALGLRLYNWVAVSPRRFALAQRLAGIFSRIIAPASSWLRLPGFTGWGFSKDFPRPAARPFRDRWKDHQLEQRNSPLMPTPQVAPPPPAVSTPAATTSRETKMERFARELAAVGGSFTPCHAEDLAATMLSYLRQRGIAEVQAWEAPNLPAGLLEALRFGGIQVRPAPRADLPAGLTGALGAIAESGSLVLAGGAGRPLTASLLPPIHLAVLHVSQIVEGLPAALQLPGLIEAPSAVLVTGPSRTADIEMTLTIGVHGPGEVQVFCVI